MVMRMVRPFLVLLCLMVLFTSSAAARAVQNAPTPALRVVVEHDGKPVADATVTAGGAEQRTSALGVATLPAAPGVVEIRVSKEGFVPATATVTVTASGAPDVTVELEETPTLEEEVIVVSSTRTDKRVEDLPLRVEVVPSDEVQEKIMMTPGDVSMLLAETNGLRVQSTSPSLGGANVRIQGQRGRYTQILADGLPLFGGQTGAIGLLHIPPMDLGQVEVIKGVASALYGMSAIGGVVNLVSRRPPEEGHEAEVLVNTHTHAGADFVNWLAGSISDRWGYTFVGGAHLERRSDLDKDGWTDLPEYERIVARPRFFWENGSGRSFFATVGVMAENRDGGTLPGHVAPDGAPFDEGLDTRQFDSAAVGRMVTGAGRVVAARVSLTRQNHTHTFGPVIEHDRHGSALGEVSVTGGNGPHTWVAGAAVGVDSFHSDDVPRFNYTYTIPGVFVQDDYSPVGPLTLSGSARVDFHNEYGTFFSPRLSVLLKPAEDWYFRVSGGRGHFAPSPFTEETDATGLTPVAPLGDLEAERATSFSGDVTWAPAPFEITGTVFKSRIDGALELRESGDPTFPVHIAALDGPVSNWGTELIFRYHREDFDIVATHMYLSSSEPALGGVGRQDVPLNPRNTASFDLLKQIGPARIGFEVFFTGRQFLEDNPYRDEGFAHVLYGGLVDWKLSERARFFVNIENVGDVRQTKEDPLVRPVRSVDGRWTVDAWAPLEGRTVNAGVRFKF